jgi:hypothetical protein
MDPLVLFVTVLFVVLLVFVMGGSSTKFELHGYQSDFLEKLGSSQGSSAAEALQGIVDRAMADVKVKAAIFDDFHCVHCGSVSPAEWIKARKGKKAPHALALSDKAVAFLGGALLVPVAKVGEPPKRQIVEGARTADANKAARCCVDWAIKNFGAVADGEPRPE